MAVGGVKGGFGWIQNMALAFHESFQADGCAKELFEHKPPLRHLGIRTARNLAQNKNLVFMWFGLPDGPPHVLH